MNRRSFLMYSAAAALALALPERLSSLASAPAQWTSQLQENGGVNPHNVLKVNFGPDLQMTALHRINGIWYASLQNTTHPSHRFWLKSYNGRDWGSLNWQPKRNSPALSYTKE